MSVGHDHSPDAVYGDLEWGPAAAGPLSFKGEDMENKLINMMTDVDEFQRKILELPCAPGPLAEHRFDFKVGHMHEELNEFETAYAEGHLDAQVDALVDLIYVAFGALLEMGVPPDEAFGTVHEANMRKVRGETKRGEAHDAVKPDGWTPPSHAELLAALRLRSKVSAPLLEATIIVQERAASYNAGTVRREDHFPLGVTSIFQMMWVKLIRMRSDIEAGRPVNRDHLIDFINYASFGVNHLDGRPL